MGWIDINSNQPDNTQLKCYKQLESAKEIEIYSKNICLKMKGKK